MTSQTLIITGGAGFIGSHFADRALQAGYKIIIYDKLTYAGKRENIKNALDSEQAEFIRGDILDSEKFLEILNKHHPMGIINFAAESHVDNSIKNPENFIQTNIIGVFKLLNSSLEYYNNLDNSQKDLFRFVQISTDEVYGDLGPFGRFNESSPEWPNSPYSASKASGDLLAHAWHKTYNLPIITTNCSNNYGPRQDKEKLIPNIIYSAINNHKITIYGDGSHIRDWIHVKDHCEGVLLALKKGEPGRSYCLGGGTEMSNLDLSKKICEILDILKPRKDHKKYSEQISLTQDRPGHDWRYAIDDSRAQRELGYKHWHSFEDALRETIKWHLGSLKAAS